MPYFGRARQRRAFRERARLDGVSPYHPYHIIDQQKAKRDREQVEEAIVAGDGDGDLKED